MCIRDRSVTICSPTVARRGAMAVPVYLPCHPDLTRRPQYLVGGGYKFHVLPGAHSPPPTGWRIGAFGAGVGLVGGW
eukprot:9250880-Pyramimonas_sp.AAC.2